MTILLARGAGDPDRVAHAVRVLRPSPLGEVAGAVTIYASSRGGMVYVERVGDGYRWSPATRGGPSPLARQIARFVRCDPFELTIGFVTIDGWCVVRDPDEPRSNRYAIFESSADHGLTRAAILGAAASDVDDGQAPSG